jgi:hypothetical protein
MPTTSSGHNKVVITGPPRRGRPDPLLGNDVYELPLNGEPSSLWYQHWHGRNWTLSSPQNPEATVGAIRFPWVDDKAALYRMLNAIKAAVDEVNTAVAKDQADLDQAAAEKATKQEQREQERQAVLDSWWGEKGRS